MKSGGLQIIKPQAINYNGDPDRFCGDKYNPSHNTDKTAY
jgi:hypothetical protein